MDNKKHIFRFHVLCSRTQQRNNANNKNMTIILRKDN